ncbi:MAG: putative Rossmann fold flavoprotein [Methylophagaceae bacterium]
MSSSPKQYDVIILGAGASGLLCAITSAKQGRRVLVLERSNKVGKKILMSGGGRCNFTNQFVEASNFISQNPHFSKAALKRYTQWDFIEMVDRHNIGVEQRQHNQLFCLRSAKDILNMLLEECNQVNVEIKTHCDVENVNALALNDQANKQQPQQTPLRYQVQFSHDKTSQTLSCQSLVIATGALSVPSLGGSGQGYDIAQQFGLKVTPRQAGLVPFMFSDDMKPVCERLSGLAVEVTAACHKHSFTESMLFTHRGLSGPAILQISNYWQPGDTLSIDLLPNRDASDWLLDSKQQYPKNQLKTILSHQLAKPLINELQARWWPDKSQSTLTEFTDKQLIAIGDKLNQWTLKPSATEGYRTAEVTLGGIDTDAISSKTMEAKQHPGLYFIGEVMDVTGHLGGFNFQWAWSSGYSAGLFV